MATPNLVLKQNPNVPDGVAKLHVVYEDQANPLNENEYPEFAEDIDIPSDQEYNVALIESLVSQAYAKALVRAQEWADAWALKAIIEPLVSEYIETS